MHLQRAPHEPLCATTANADTRLVGDLRLLTTQTRALLDIVQEDMALIISNTKRRPRMTKEKSPSGGYGSG